MGKVEALSTIVLLSLIAMFLLLLPSVHGTSVKNCDRKQDYAVKVHGVEISPEPVVSGKPATFNISASTGQAISGGSVVIDVAYVGIHVHRETHDLCEEVSCPIAAGDFVLSHSQTLPGFTPPGSYTLKMTMEDEKKQQLSCISFNFKIKLGSYVSDS